jgi:hypothetical protein
MNAPLEPAHSRFGGSVASRILRCPGSVQLITTVPEHLRRSSVYAVRGSSCHAAMARLIERECSLDDLVGETIGDYTLTRDDIENALRPVLTYVDELLDQPGAEYFLERRVVFPGIADTFGTADLIARIGDTIHVIDFKFGSGVQVLARYADGAVNAQLQFYAVSARSTFPDFFAGIDNIVLSIVQPVTTAIDAEMVSTTPVTHAELDEFITLFRKACAEALSPSPRLERGDHCRFCAARPVCPEHTKPLLDLARFMVPTPAAPPDRNTYLRLIAAGLDLVDATKDIGRALHDQAKCAIDAGGRVPGYTLTAGRAVRNWKNETTAAPDLLKLGLARDDVLVEVLRSPKQVEIRAKARGVKVPKELVISRPSGVALVRIKNAHAPILGRDELMRAFSGALDAFQKGSKHD